MSDDRTIPLRLVRHAAFLAGSGRTQLPQPASRWAAMTAGTLDGPDCARWRSMLAVTPRRAALEHLGHGSLAALALRTHRLHGPREVRRIWGVGVRELQREAARPLRHD